MANVISTLLKLDSKDFKSGMKSAQASIAETQGTLNKGKAAASSFWSSLTGAQKLTGIGTAAIAVGAVANKAIDDASNLTESINAVEVAYGSAADSVLKLGDNSAESFGLSKRALNEFAVQFAAFDSKIAAGTGEGQAKVLEDITQRVADFASVMNIDLADAATVFQSSLAGETEPIRRFGIDMSAAAVEAFALQHNLIKTHSELTEGIKVQARYGLLMEQTAKVEGDFANTSDGLANSKRILTANVENLSAALGKELVPEAAAAAGQLSQLTEWALKADEAVTDLTQTDVAGWARRSFKFLPNPLNQGKAIIDDIRDFAQGTSRAIGGEFDRGRDSIAEFTETAGRGRDAVSDLSDAVKDGGQAWGGYMGAVAGATSAVGGAHGDYLTMKDDLEAINEEARNNTLGVLADAVGKVGDALDESFGSLEDDLGSLDLFDNITEQFDKIADAQKKATDPQGVRDLNREVRRLQGQLLDYLRTVDDIPPDKVTEIIAQIRTGDIVTLKATLDELTQDRFINIGIATKGIPLFQSANAVFTPGAAPSAPTFNGQSAIPSVPMIDQRQITYNFPVGTTPTTQYIDATINQRRNGSR